MLRVFKQYFPIRNLFFVLGEGLVIYLSVLLATLIILDTSAVDFNTWLLLKILLITFVCQSCLYYADMYNIQITNSFIEIGLRLLQALGLASIILAIIYIAFPSTIIGKGIFIVSICFLILLIVSWRFSYRVVLKHGLFDQRIFILGPSELAENIKQEIKNKSDCGYSVSLEYPNTVPKDIKISRDEYDGLCRKAQELEIDKIVVALKEKRETFPMGELLKCKIAGIDVIDGNSFYEMLTGKLIVKEIHPTWFIFSEGFQKSRTRLFFKRSLDLILSLVLLVTLIPLIIITAFLIKIESKGSIFYSQERIGEKRNVYRIYKFRSMIENAEKESGPVCATEDDRRITRIGKIIRKLRIDEIPQLWNVLKGDMSFVGPRPEREFFVEKYEKKIPYYNERFSVKPGITGWAQICYHYSDTTEDTTEKLNYDLFYIKNMSTMMDLMIVLRTIKIVLFGRGAR